MISFGISFEIDYVIFIVFEIDCSKLLLREGSCLFCVKLFTPTCKYFFIGTVCLPQAVNIVPPGYMFHWNCVFLAQPLNIFLPGYMFYWS